ncbi:serine/threonine protein kinase with PASTA sensor(S) [Clostridium sp. CAG:921]|nr:serine/threonine protein kinase with PASTA sensor(S) [Clostridium sp. CAG:921]
MDLVGSVISSRYEIKEKIGEGGMAIVYKARCKLLNRLVAIKVLKEEYSKDEMFVKRFRAEAQSAASLTHPNIVSVYDVGQDGDINYIVMELLETKTLKDYIEENGAIDSELTLKIAAQIASALEAAHRAHIIHRDIKPHNIVLNQNMVAKVTDFGIAKIQNTTSNTITSFGSTMGSVHYFSPEHAKGGYVDEKSDLYSLGVVMYEMATGKIPFDGDSPVSVALKQIQEEPIEPIVVNPSVWPSLNQIILKAMQKSTALRYQSATEMLQDISIALKMPNSMIKKNETSVEAGATQVIPILSNVDIPNEVPNLRTRQSRRSINYDASENVLNNARIGKVSNDSENISDESEKKEFKKTKKTKIIVMIISIIALIAVLGGIGYFSLKLVKKAENDRKANEQVEVPNLVDKNFDEMVKLYQEQGFEISQEKVSYDDTVEAGFIISQTPEAKTMTTDKKISVVVSKGQRLVNASDVTGKDIKVARYELEDTLGFKVEVEEVISEKVTAGIVISQDVKDEEKPYGSVIKLKVSKGDGKATVVMPSVLGKTEEDAKKELEDLKLTVTIKYGEDKNKQNGVVILQNYPQNQSLKEGALVEITVNKLTITKNITLDLLELQGGTPLDKDKINVKVTASIDGGATNQIFNQDFDADEKTAKITIYGYKTAILKIYLDDKLTKEQTIKFTE